VRILMAIGKFGLQWQCDTSTSPAYCMVRPAGRDRCLQKEGIEKRNEGSPTRFPDEPKLLTSRLNKPERPDKELHVQL